MDLKVVEKNECRVLFRRHERDKLSFPKKAEDEETIERTNYLFRYEVREYPPSPRTILFYKKVGERGMPFRDRKSSFFVQMPWVVFIKKPMRRVLAAVAKKPIESENDEVYFPPIANVYANHNLCLAFMNRQDREWFEMSPFDEVIYYFWNAQSDLSDVWTGRKAIAHNFGSVYNWEKMDLDEVIEKISFRPISIKKLVSRFFKLGEIEDIPVFQEEQE